MTAILDHRFYPHIIDLIWSHMDHESVAASREVCKGWRKRANRVLQRHLTVRPAPYPDTDDFLLSVKSFTHPDVAYPSFLVQRDDAIHSGFPATVTGMLSDESLKDLFSNIRYLDLQHVRGMEETAVLLSLVMGLKTHYGLRATRNAMQLYGDVYPEADTGVYFVNSRETTEGNPLVSMYARSLVINLDQPPISYGPLPDDEVEDEGTLWEWLSSYTPGRLKQLTLVFHPSDEERGTFQTYAAPNPRAVAGQTIRWLGDRWISATTLLVGMERFFRSMDEYREYKRQMREYAAHQAERITGTPKRGRNLKIFTHDEYRKRIGDATYTLYTEQ
ncbi:hypothetical protein A1Q2_08423 [Trichosporon asahii var. asahii CBS 8904]|uniref:F-box domain-containing protein n=1 Tax=Trichosporon asahii var. asahii (strain CBS 8904) TaxID=1220162 RepID=K1V982_TRIAC|nr:hypothetical protein A1Q2_08423 [Trichosporon asahii var. asahii CBS 8904]